MKIYLSTWLAEKAQGEALTHTKASHRLLSYFFLLEQKVSKVKLRRYLNQGIVDLRKGK